jgi:Icc-related predicted phosphoesterase
LSRIIVIGDIHDYRERLDGALELVAGEPADLVLLVGDIALDPPWHEPERTERRAAHDDSLREIVARVGQACGCPVALVPGNHELPALPGDLPAIDLDGKVEQVGPLLLAGFGGAGPDRFGFPYEWSEEEAADRLARLERLARGRRLDVLLCHAPPAETPLDVTVCGAHVGSSALREALERWQPRLAVCGHIHEAWGLAVVGGVPCINAGALGEPYGQVLVWTVEWDDGPQRIVSIRDTSDGGPTRRQWWPEQRLTT